MSEHLAPDPLRSAALSLLRPYIERGDDWDEITYGSMGAFRRDFDLQIGPHGFYGYPKPKRGRDAVVVRIGDQCREFSVRQLIAELKAEGKQLALF